MTIPWGTNQLRRLGEALRDNREPPESCPPYRHVMIWFDALAATVLEEIRQVDWTPIVGDIPFEVVSRSKTIDTLRQKLRRDRHTPLQNVQDIAGVRFEADMTLTTQDAVVREIALLFDHDPDDPRVVRDLRSDPHKRVSRCSSLAPIAGRARRGAGAHGASGRLGERLRDRGRRHREGDPLRSDSR
ncbi:hypothetical protein [Microbacterium sp. gxy059]|uniref:hypothetical protein n=1 Tax=Microbacterium sp. gxy059 TaxID=2957199 RepID=UPI003D95B61F